ncbi:MAG: ATP-binding protein [Sciscionella sp.]
MTPLRTVSLHRRVTLTAIIVLAVVLLGQVFAVHALFDVANERSLNAVLASRTQLARQLVRQPDVTPGTLVRRVDGGAVRAQLVLTDAETLGSPIDGSAGPHVRRVLLTGPGQLDGAMLTLSVESPLPVEAGTTLLRVLLLTGLGALLFTAAVLLVTVRFALAPLDAVTALARSITHGGRGRRLFPTRTDTELGRTASAFDEMLDALEGAERQAGVSEERTRRFVADAAHELRTPIAGVQAAAEAAMHLPADADPEQRQRLEMLLVREAGRAAQLVDGLLDLARIDAGVELHRGPVDLLALAEAEAERVTLLHPELTVRVSGPALVIDADQDRITQIVANLVDNAAQASPTGGLVRIAIEGGAGFVSLTVSDAGPGVPPADRERIFDRLVRLDESRDRRAGGSGLGLAIARGFARAHGGELTCEAPCHGGAVFRLVLPRRHAPAAFTT